MSARMLRLARPLGLAVALMVPTFWAGGGPPASATPTGSYDITVDDANKTIRIVVKIAFYVRPPLTASDPRQPALEAAIERIRNDIATFWKDQYFLCYKISIEPTLRLVPDESQIAADEAGILLDDSRVPIVAGDDATRPVDADVKGRRESNSDAPGRTDPVYLSESPRDRVVASTGPPPRDDQGVPQDSTWPVVGTPGLYSHELGHILGLDDNYKPKDPLTSGPAPTLPGAADDMMRLQGQPIDPTTITRLIRRSGQVDESKLKCSMKADLARSDFGLRGWVGGEITMHMWTCRVTPVSNAGGPPQPMKFTGTFVLNGEINAGPFGSAAGGGAVNVTTNLTPGDPAFTVTATSNGETIKLGQAIAWNTGRPLATTTATLSEVVPLANAVVFSPDAKECP